MPSGKYFRTQAQLFASLALATKDPQIAACYSEMALEQLAKAAEAEPEGGEFDPSTIDRDRDDGSDMDRD